MSPGVAGRPDPDSLKAELQTWFRDRPDSLLSANLQVLQFRQSPGPIQEGDLYPSGRMQVARGVGGPRLRTTCQNGTILGTHWAPAIFPFVNTPRGLRPCL